VYRAVEEVGQVIDVLVGQKRDLGATRRFVTRALGQAPRPREVTTDQAQADPRVLDELVPAAGHVRDKDATHPIESDHGG
jgi:transposase, IS6 family